MEIRFVQLTDRIVVSARVELKVRLSNEIMTLYRNPIIISRFEKGFVISARFNHTDKFDILKQYAEYVEKLADVVISLAAIEQASKDMRNATLRILDGVLKDVSHVLYKPETGK